MKQATLVLAVLAVIAVMAGAATKAGACGRDCTSVYAGSYTETVYVDRYAGCNVLEGNPPVPFLYEGDLIPVGACIDDPRAWPEYEQVPIQVTRHRCVITEEPGPVTYTLDLDGPSCHSYCWDDPHGLPGPPPPA